MEKIPFNHAIKILLVTNALILVSGAMLGPIYALFIQRIGGDLLDASLAFGFFSFVAGLTTLWAGRFADKIRDSELIVVFGYAVIGLGFFGYVFVDSLLGLLIVQAIIGFGEAVYSPAFDSLYSKHLMKLKGGSVWGAWESINYFTLALGAVSGGLLVTLFGFNTMFVVMSLMSFASAIYIYFLPRKVL